MFFICLKNKQQLLYIHEYLFTAVIKKHFFSTYIGIVIFNFWFLGNPTDSPVNSNNPYILTKVPNFESESSTKTLLSINLIHA